MRKLVSIATVLMMAAMTLPMSSAAPEVVEESYTGACCAREGVSGENAGLGLVLFPNSEDSIYTQSGIRPIGGVRLNALQGTYSNLVIKLNDATFGEDAAASTCFWNPDGDNLCDGDDYGGDTACGGPALLGAPFESDFATVFLYILYVESDLTPCGGSTGSVVGTFS